jgi:hypothetical protein
MCELHVTLKLPKALSGFSDADARIFPKQKYSCSYSLLNIRTTALEYIGTIVRISKEIERDFK